MTKEIDLEKPLSEFDLRYLVDRCRWEDIRMNAEALGLPEPNLPSQRGLRAQVPRAQLRNTDSFKAIASQLEVKLEDDEPEPEEESFPPDGDDGDDGVIAVNYSKLTVPQLQEELSKRREEYVQLGDDEGVTAVSFSKEDKKGDLVAKLEADDEAIQSEDDDEDEDGASGNGGN